MATDEMMNLLSEAEQALASLVLPPAKAVPPVARPHCWEDFQQRVAAPRAPRRDVVGNNTVTLRIELGRTRLCRHELPGLRTGAVVPLDKAAGDPVDVYADERLVARGEVVVVGNNLGVRVTEIVSGAEGNR